MFWDIPNKFAKEHADMFLTMCPKKCGQLSDNVPKKFRFGGRGGGPFFCPPPTRIAYFSDNMTQLHVFEHSSICSEKKHGRFFGDALKVHVLGHSGRLCEDKYDVLSHSSCLFVYKGNADISLTMRPKSMCLDILVNLAKTNTTCCLAVCRKSMCLSIPMFCSSRINADMSLTIRQKAMFWDMLVKFASRNAHACLTMCPHSMCLSIPSFVPTEARTFL